ncbi:methyltransferase domain protein [Rhizoctonia solani]|uniref:Methyltransferase domain protein n=1 Tax=Rhizoctonia solani TaxID=456999 RepID=A0A8H8P3Z9_9AGAM|nr:methyltransferase domain protein [Rhizoctonia solani]QRW24045.1 methyltransferase domain protein [Rhizoctonia solani]
MSSKLMKYTEHLDQAIPDTLAIAPLSQDKHGSYSIGHGGIDRPHVVFLDHPRSNSQFLGRLEILPYFIHCLKIKVLAHFLSFRSSPPPALSRYPLIQRSNCDMEISYTDEFNRQGTVYFVNDNVNEQVQYVDSDSDTMSTCSTHSASTITSSEVSDFYQERFGRVFPMDDNIPVVLPIDEPEHDRLEKLHRCYKLLVGSNYFGPLKEHMARTPHPRVLDIRTQQGTWVQEMASEFPHAQFISLDLVPMIPHVPRPNITFEVYDLYAGLAEPDESFDIIHARDCINSVAGKHAYEAYDTDTPAIRSSPRVHRGLQIIRQAVSSQGVMIDHIPSISHWLDPSSGLWSSPSHPTASGATPILTTRKRGFTQIETRIAHLPDGTWHPDPCHPLMLEKGVDEELVRSIVEDALEELMDPTIQTVWKYYMTHAVKI